MKNTASGPEASGGALLAEATSGPDLPVCGDGTRADAETRRLTAAGGGVTVTVTVDVASDG